MIQHKIVIINKYLAFCTLEWCCLKVKRKGVILDSNSFAQRMEILLIVFHKQGIKYDDKMMMMLMLMGSFMELFFCVRHRKKVL